MASLFRCFLWCFCIFLFAHAANAAGLKRSVNVSAKDVSNPQPLQDDILLPLPCGLSMAFRVIAIPVKNILWDTTFTMGSENTAREGMEFYERPFEKTLAAPFQQADLPKAWQKALPKDTNYTYYFIGKYEINNAQWDAVMQDACAETPLSKRSAQPKTSISWYDVQNFLLHYNQWLLENAPDALPKFLADSRNKGFMRLPTEAEWEYAARGGNRVTKEWFTQESFPPLAEGTSLRDYAIYRPSDAAVVQEDTAPIGSRKANPLGIHDMFGNAAEMVQDSFHFSLGGRLHGSAGGFIRKGGSFMGTETDIMPGRRDEVALFTARGPSKVRDMGFRLVLSGINTPGGNRQDVLKKAWKNMGQQASSKTSQKAQEELTLLMKIEQDEEVKAVFAKLNGLLKDNAIEQERQNSTIAEGLVRTVLYMIETIRNYGVRHNFAFSRVVEVKEVLALIKEKKRPAKEIASMEKTVEAFVSAQKNQQIAMESATNFYKTKLDEALKYSPELIEMHTKNIQTEWQQKSLLAKNMRENLVTFTEHLDARRKNETKKLTKQAIIMKVLPTILHQGLEF